MARRVQRTLLMCTPPRVGTGAANPEVNTAEIHKGGKTGGRGRLNACGRRRRGHTTSTSWPGTTLRVGARYLARFEGRGASAQ